MIDCIAGSRESLVKQRRSNIFGEFLNSVPEFQKINHLDKSCMHASM